MGGRQADGFILLEHPGDRAEITAGAEHMQHPLAPLGQPAIKAPTLRRGTPQQGAVEIGHQHQLGLLRQGRRELPLQLLAQGGQSRGAGAAQRIAGAAAIGQTAALYASAIPLARFYAKNRRDGARLISSALVITSVGAIRIDHPIGQVVTLLGTLVCLYWWSCYRRLES